jgi:predicted transcriptional regulator
VKGEELRMYEAIARSLFGRVWCSAAVEAGLADVAGGRGEERSVILGTDSSPGPELEPRDEPP